VANIIDRIISIIIPHSFTAFKVRLFFFLGLGLIVDFSVKMRMRAPKPGAEFMLSAPDLAITLVCIITILFLVIVNWILYQRHQQLSRDVLEFAREQGIPESMKDDVIRTILRESRRFF
jgi:hypothetical protein